MEAPETTAKANGGQHLSPKQNKPRILIVAVIVVIFLLLAITICLVCLLAGCCLKHQWEDATCTAPITCSECGKTDGEPLPHTWRWATCATPQTCSICGETQGAVTDDHVWKDATYTEPRTCVVCGEKTGSPKRPKRTEANDYDEFEPAIKEALNLLPNCDLRLEQVGSNSYSIHDSMDIIGIFGVKIDDWDAIAMIDPDKPDAQKHLEQISIALLMACDTSLEYEDAKGYYMKACDDGKAFLPPSSGIYCAEGMESGMLAFAVDLLLLN
ncbi:MAG: hypothetical protein E7442_05605 [Ruminococcaceae bacterium]|nr:hypothetical protein [Oscillospiraceae bacterium]